MSFKKYRFIDLFIFFIIYAVLEYLIETAAVVWFPTTIYSVSLLLPIAILLMVRWEWFSIVNILIYGALYVLYTSRPGTFDQYMIYIIGNIGLILCIFLFTKKRSQKMFSTWYLSILTVVICYLAMEIFRGIGAMIFTDVGIEIIPQYLLTDSLNLVFALLVVLVIRKSKGLLVNQKHYLLELEKEKEKEKEAAKHTAEDIIDDEY